MTVFFSQKIKKNMQKKPHHSNFLIKVRKRSFSQKFLLRIVLQTTIECQGVRPRNFSPPFFSYFLHFPILLLFVSLECLPRTFEHSRGATVLRHVLTTFVASTAISVPFSRHKNKRISREQDLPVSESTGETVPFLLLSP